MNGPHEEWVERAPPPEAVAAESEAGEAAPEIEAGAEAQLGVEPEPEFESEAETEPEAEPELDAVAEAPETVQLNSGHRYNEVRCLLRRSITPLNTFHSAIRRVISGIQLVTAAQIPEHVCD